MIKSLGVCFDNVYQELKRVCWPALIRTQNRHDFTQNAIKDVIRSYFTPEMYKLYQFEMPSTAEAKNLFLILRKDIFLKINILANTQGVYCITRPAIEVRVGDPPSPRQTAPP